MELPKTALCAPERFAGATAEIVKIHRRTLRSGARISVHYIYQDVEGAALCAWLGAAEYVGGATLYALRDGGEYVVIGARGGVSTAGVTPDSLSAEERAFFGRIGAREREEVCAFVGAGAFSVSRVYDLSDEAERARLLASASGSSK